MKTIKEATRKWRVEGDASGWIVENRFPEKWKAELAIKIYKLGGTYPDYKKQIGLEKENRPKRGPWRAINEIERALRIIKRLNPTCQEIIEYGEYESQGGVSFNDGNSGYWKPRLRNTWGSEERWGRVYIDIGCGEYRLMLDRKRAPDFIAWLKEKRQQ